MSYFDRPAGIELIRTMQLHRQSVLIVDDELLTATFLAELVADHGGDAVGPADTVRKALDLLASQPITSAILDVTIKDGDVTPVAAALAKRNIPFIVHTGGTVPLRLRNVFGSSPILTKPARPSRIVAALAAAIAELRNGSTIPLAARSSLGHVLVIEDEANSAMILEAHVRALGCTSVDQAETETGAILAAGRRRPDLMLVDLHLREGTGLGAARTISLTFDIPHVFITAFPAHAVGIEEALVVRKPYTRQTLAAAIAPPSSADALNTSLGIRWP